MVFLGVVLAAAAIMAGLAIVTENSSTASLGVFDHHVPGVHTEAEVFIAGLVVGFAIVAGLTFSAMSLRRSARARREFRDLTDDREESMSLLVQKNQRLQQELVRARGDARGHARGEARGGGAPTTTDVPVYPPARS